VQWLHIFYSCLIICMHLTNTMTINMFIHFLISNVVELAKKQKKEIYNFKKSHITYLSYIMSL